MKKLLKKVFVFKEKPPVKDPIALLIARLCDPTDVLYDEKFAQSQHANTKKQ